MNTKLPAPSLADTRLVDENKADNRFYREATTPAPAPSNTFLVPTNMSDAMRLGEYMAASNLVPKDFQRKPADCLMVVMQSVRWQMDPFAVIQQCSVIQGKLMYNGQLVAAVVNTRGKLKQRLSYSYTGEGKERTITVSGQFPGEDEPREVEVVLGKVKTTNAQWDKQPDQQLCYHGCRVWARRHMPELMLGVYSEEEWDDEAAAVANGSSIHHPDDYSDGTPERLTKAPEVPKYSRAEQAAIRWQEKLTAWQSQMDSCHNVNALHEWGSANTIIVSGSPPEIKKEVYDYFRITLENLREAELSNQVVHDSDSEDPRPASMADFYDESSGGEPVSNTPQTTGGTPDSPHQPAAARAPNLRKVAP